MDLGFNMNILDIGGGFTGSEFQLKQVTGKQLRYDLGCFDKTFELKLLTSWHVPEVSVKFVRIQHF